jgi:predicted amidophosphoribosyltransferase
MGDSRRAFCRSCGKHRDKAGELSWTGLCQECGESRFSENLAGLMLHTGPYFQAHRRACIAAFGGVLLDDVPVSVHGDSHAS